MILKEEGEEKLSSGNYTQGIFEKKSVVAQLQKGESEMSSRRRQMCKNALK